MRFFTPARFYVGRAAAIQHPAKGKAARRLLPVFDLPTPTGAARKNVSPWSSHEVGDVFMTQLPAAVCFSGQSLSIIDRDGTPYMSARELGCR
ncbi:hypothetical protein OK117_09525 [Xylella fastidiosa subsp. fastidiosa]|uniref:Uncharacterized protein n=1 Tax=Xylella fastidiosa subsp. fastidiosa TaxID=644356 RepID=A0AAJ5R372_XYLFS|nr:hypothetical protein [Xylella fastidiosa]WCF29550.1 hypothetical protein OK117_09525 [Xylella fastidiosa subsp. fastidiosa]